MVFLRRTKAFRILTKPTQPEVLTANLTATGLAEDGLSVDTRTADPTIPLDLDAGGHYSMELKILWSESSVRVRPPPPAYLKW
jgi:hypothetical protein